MADTVIKPVMGELAACLCAELDQTELCFCGLIAGMGIPIDYVGDCEGVGYVRLITAYPSVNFPTPDITEGCVSLLAYQVAVGVLRPAPQMDNDGNIDPADVARISEQVLDDIAAIRKAIRCCFREKFEDVQYLMGEYTPIEEDSVAGGEWLLTIQEAF
jgi:hypothetical protein